MQCGIGSVSGWRLPLAYSAPAALQGVAGETMKLPVLASKQLRRSLRFQPSW